MLSKDSLFELVQNDLSALEAELTAVIHSPVDLIATIGKHLVAAGGKRLRPALYLLCAKHNQTDSRAVMPIAVAIELIHTATLVHDDVIDQAATRRGKPTASAVWGNHVAVLAGDFLFAKAFSLVANYGSNEILRLLTDMICSLCEGEILQMKTSFNPAILEQEYLERIAKKTADFIGVSCRIGGMVANLAAEDVDKLHQYGHAVGMAFQITDDILDITASAMQLGKPAGNDLRQGILTLPVIYALQQSKHRDELYQLIIEGNMTEDKVMRGLKIVRDSDAIEYSYQRVQDYLQQARTMIPACLADNYRASLQSIADFIGLRKF